MALVETFTSLDRSDEVLKEMREHMREGEKLSAEEMADAARRHCPVRSGNLLSTIQAPGDGSVHAGGDKAPYAGLVHDGSIHNPPKPFMTEAFEETRDKFETRMEEV